MADYWKKKLEELNQSTKKTSSTTKTSSSDYWKTNLTELEEEEKQKAVAPVKSAPKKEEKDKPLLMKAIDKVGDFLDDSADVVGKILTGDIFKKDDNDIAPTVSTATKADQKDDDDGKFNLKNAASWAGNAAMSGLASFNKGITSTADVLLGKPLQSLGWENNPVSKMADYYDDQYTAWRNETAEDAAKLGGGKGLGVAGDLVEGAVAALPNALAALMTMGASTGVSMTSTGLQQAALYDSGNLLTKIGMKITDMVKNPQYWTSFAQTMGNEYEEAKAMGASDTVALYGSTISSLLNAGVEIGIDGMSGIQGLPAKVMSGNKGAFFEWVESSLSEGGEEMVQGVISNIVAKVAYDPETKVFDAKEMGKEFAMGTAVGGLLGGGQIAAMKGADAVNNAIQTHEDNKLTENEQKVVDKVVEDRVKEAEKDGEKLTAKEKNKIYEEVENDLEKGYISTDTIEEVLGGETYAEYKNTTDSENALREEFETLGGMKKSDFTAKQEDRYNELKAKLAEIDSGDARNQLKTKLSGEVSALAEGSRLAESYNERARRGEKFDADLTAYDEKQKAVVQKAIDSGILNNTNRTHEFVDMVAKISADKGVLFDFTNNEKLKGSGFAVDGKTVNGFVNKDGVTVNIDSAKSLNSVVGHEITHVLEGTDFYRELQNVVVEYAKSKGDYQGRYDSLASLYKGIEGADIDAELTADLIGDYLFTDADFVNNLSVTNRNVFQKIYDEIKYLYKVATAGSKEARELAKVKRAFDKAYRESGKVSGDTKYSISDSDGKQLTKEQGEYFKDSKMRDENGNLKVMYHGSQDAGFHEFDASMSDDGASFFFVDRNDVAASYSGTSETYEAQSIRTAEDMNRFMESIDAEGYEVVEKDGKFVLLYEGERVADSRTAKGIYDEFCWYEGVGQGDANYKVYLNLTNPLEIDAKGRPWNKIDAEFSQEVYDRYKSLTAEEKDALVDLAEWEDFRMFNSEIQEAKGDALASAYAKMGEDCNIYDLFSVAADSFSEEAMRENARKYLKTRDFAARAKEQGYDGVIFKNIVDNGGYSNGSEGASTVAIAFDSSQIKSVANEKPTKDPDIRYSLSEDSEGRELSNAVKTRFGKSKVLDENGSLKVVYHGTATGEFSIFDKSKGSVEGDFGSGFYFTDNEADVSEHYEGGGPDFDNKVARRAEQIEAEEEIDYDEAEEMARKELYKGAHKFEVYLNIENPAIVGETVLFDNESYLEQYNEEDYDDYDDYIGDVEQLLADDVENIVWEVERSTGAYSVDGLADVLYNAYYEGGIGIEELKTKINDLYLEDENGNLIGNEVARQIIESLGYDGIIDPTVSGKWNMDIEEGTTHYIVFKPNQIKAVTNQNPTDNPDIHRSLSRAGETAKKHGRYHIKGEDVRYNDIAPVQDRVQDVQDVQDGVQDIAPVAKESAKPKERRLAWYNHWGEKVADVPVMDDIAPSEPSLPQLREELADIEQRAKEAYAAGDIDALTDIGERHTEITAKIRQMEAEESERVASLDDADAPPEVDAPYQNEGVAPADPFADRDIKDVGDRKVNAYMYENPEVKPFFQEEANILLGELRNTTKGERFYTPTEYSSEYGAESYGVWTGTSRQTTDDISYLLDTLKYSYAEIEKGLNAIIEDNGKENNAISKRIEFLLNDRLMKGHADIDGHEIPPNQDYINLLNEKQITEYTEEARRSFFESVGATEIAPVKAVDDIAPTYRDTHRKGEIEGQQTMDVMRRGANGKPFVSQIKGADEIAPTYDTRKRGEAEGQQTMLDEGETDDGKIAKVMVGEPEGAQKKVNGWQKFRTNILDKFSVFEDLALKRKNRELMGKANYMLSSEARAQNMIGNGDDGVKSLNAIRTEVEKTGQTERFYNYMYHRHNVDRMSLEEKARPVAEGLYQKFGHLRKDQLHAIAAKEITDKTTEKTAQSIRDAREYLKAIDAKNKPVFGDSVTAEKSREIVSFYERANPEFKRWADDVYTYVNHLRGLMVENGVISQETADLWAEMYPHYVPIRRLGKSGAAVNVPLDTGRTGINAPIKRAEGGNSDIMDMFDTIALRTEQTYRAIAKNSFGVELKNTLGTTLQKSTASLDEMIDSVDTHEKLLKKGEDGANPTFTVFENGERVEFEITDAMYDALKPVSDGLRYVNTVANTISKVHKGVLTEYNPVFSMTNAIKDAQDILINSQHAVKTYANIPTAIKHMAKGGAWYREYVKNGGEQNTYFDGKTNTFKEEDKAWKKVVGMPLRGISWWNNKIETLPRLAEYIASRKKGASVEVAMLDAARVTTNFQAGGDVAKFIDRNGATFLNASIQGFNQQVRNVREAKANGAKGWLQLAAKVAIAGLPVLFLNEALWGDDEEYEELSDYVKDSYYIVAKFDDGKFVRIPKGRAMAVIQDAFEQVKNALTGDDEVDLRNFLDVAFTNLAPNNPIDNNIIAPVVQAVQNKAWYGGDIVPTRLQDMPSAEQYDESTDSISKWLGEKTNTSPMKWNYVLNQYGGGIADMSLPYLTPEAEGDGNKLIAPLRDKFTTDAVMNNQNVTDFYDTVDELTKNANSAKATDEDILKSKYMNAVNAELSALYQMKRDIQNNIIPEGEVYDDIRDQYEGKKIPDKVKYSLVREVQAQIDDLTKNGLSTYEDIRYEGNGDYAVIGDKYFEWYTPENGDPYWRKLNDDQVVKYNLTKNADGSHYVTDGNVHYRLDEDGEWTKISDRQLERQNEVTNALGITPDEYWSRTDISFVPLTNGEYEYAYENPGKYEVAKAVGGYDSFKLYSSELSAIKADKDEDGESISGSAKEKKTEYINNLDLDYGQKIILYRSLYDSRADQEAYNQDIVDYLNEREDISYEEMETILKELGFEVDSEGNISW